MNIEALMQSDNFQQFMKRVKQLYDDADTVFHNAVGEELPEYKGKTAGLQEVLDLPQTIIDEQQSETYDDEED